MTSALTSAALVPCGDNVASTFTLRPYQTAAVEAAVEFATAKRKGKGKVKDNGLLIEPTGSGKSLVIAEVVHRLADMYPLVFQPSKEILQQNLDKLVSYGYFPGVFSASMRSRRVSDITLATIGSVVKRADLFEKCKLLLVDEAHLINPKGGQYTSFFADLPADKIVLGLTATPYRLASSAMGGPIVRFMTHTRPRTFGHVLHVTQNFELFSQGYLAPLVYKQVPGFDRKNLQLNSTGGDYTDESVQRHFRELNFPDQIVRVIERARAAGRKSILAFTRFQSEANYVAEKILGAAVVTDKTPEKERARILTQFKAGVIDVVINVKVLSVGFDHPALDTVVLARPTCSLALYYQMVGRAVRPSPGKTEAWVIDMVELRKQFGPVESLIIAREEDKWTVTQRQQELTGRYLRELEPFA
ncbi:MAG: DEAD/DEAH box helicase [Pyrinomonadaceae bacterium]